jgi:predicted GH43/DUF377 family glycosyl hydrolase|tara:strand:+ start:30841 stop:32130 length:1290 start_codon:yes stop_codon:yes gene_type:complete
MSHADFIRRSALTLKPDPSMVVLRPFSPSAEPRALLGADANRVIRVIERVQSLERREVTRHLDQVMGGFHERHRDIRAAFERRFEEIAAPYLIGESPAPSERLLIGAYFCQEYSFQSAALFNPSIVAHPDQSGMIGDQHRIIMSLRAVGEGHVSSITFRTGIVACDGEVRLDAPNSHCSIPDVTEICGEHCVRVRCNGGATLSECVIFPVTHSQANGIEDLRLVRFIEDGGAIRYYGTYTAYSGTTVSSEMLQTDDFCNFTLRAVAGDASHNKGMALFPRRVNGRFAMLGRQDSENIWFLQSDDPYRWDGGVRILAPKYAWEFMQIGNCGSPIEIDEGWLILTHGVGAVRHYAIGAVLLDKRDPTRVLARTPEPILCADPREREGYVPNVVYTCGAIACGRTLIIPYGIADSITTVASTSIDDLLGFMI